MHKRLTARAGLDGCNIITYAGNWFWRYGAHFEGNNMLPRRAFFAFALAPSLALAAGSALAAGATPAPEKADGSAPAPQGATGADEVTLDPIEVISQQLDQARLADPTKSRRQHLQLQPAGVADDSARRERAR